MGYKVGNNGNIANFVHFLKPRLLISRSSKSSNFMQMSSYLNNRSLPKVDL